MRFFIYELTDPRDGAVFYVGKGSGNRPDGHTKEAVKGKRSRKCDRIRSILADGQKVGVSVVARFADEDAAYEAEVERIAEIGLANLTNVLPGGRGGMAKAVRMAELLPRSSVVFLAKVLRLDEQGKTVYWGGFNLTAFAREMIERFVARIGLDEVKKRFAAAGITLLTGQNNAVR